MRLFVVYDGRAVKSALRNTHTQQNENRPAIS